VDCSGHKAGYDWAELGTLRTKQNAKDIAPLAYRNSFYEGCLVYVEDPDRGF